MAHKIVYAESAWHDIDEIYDWIAERADPETAHGYVTRIHEFSSMLRDFPNRGTPRDDLAPGVRTTSFEGKAVIAYIVGREEVRILRILHHGRDIGLAFPA